MKNKVERRAINFSNLELEQRAEGEKMPSIRGMAAVFDEVCDEPIWGEFYEKLAPGCFTRALADDTTVCVAVVQHNDSVLPVARYKGGKGTLSLRETKKGLEFELVPPKTADGEALVEALRRQDIDGMSFAFRTRKDDWRGVHNGMPLRTLLEVDLGDISFVTTPAYGGTSVAVRSGEMAQAEYRSLAAPYKQQASIRARALRLKELQQQIS